MTNAPFTFVTLMHKTFKDLLGKCVLVYLDDIIVFSKIREEHEVHLRQTLDTLQRHQLVAKPLKCEFFKTELLFLGHIISAAGIGPYTYKNAVITKMPPPKDVGEVHTFLDMIAYVKKFIAGCGKLIAPLTEILGSKGTFHWTPFRDATFQTLKTALVSARSLVP